MKRIGLVALTAATLSAGTVSTHAHGWCGGDLFWPFLGFGLTVAAIEASRPVYYEPAYSYAPPVYTQAPAQDYSAPPQPAPPPPEPEPWVPSTPGAGHWVPEPEPYQYIPAKAPEPQKTASPPSSSAPEKVPMEPSAGAVTVSRTAGGVPVYINSR